MCICVTVHRPNITDLRKMPEIRANIFFKLYPNTAYAVSYFMAIFLIDKCDGSPEHSETLQNEDYPRIQNVKNVQNCEKLA